MVQVTGVRLQFGSRVLFDDVNIKFNQGNCYGIIGANGAGKSTFLKLLTGEIAPNKGEVTIEKGKRMSVLAQNQEEFDNLTVLNTVMLGHKRLAQLILEREAAYKKSETHYTDELGMQLANLEAEFAEIGGWEADSEASRLLKELGLSESLFETKLAQIDAKTKVKVLLARALFMNPDILVLDEPTNNLDYKTTKWLEDFLYDFTNTVLIVSHNRHFLNKVCTHICDIDFGKISLFVGNYDFWYESSQLLLRQAKDQNKKAEQRAQELKDFIARFAANASKSRQATSRKKELEKLDFATLKPSSRKYPYIDFKPDRELGNDVLFVEGLTKKGYFENLTFSVKKTDKIAFMSSKSLAITMLFKILAGEEKADSGSFRFGITSTLGYLPADNSKYFNGVDMNLVEWISQFSKEKDQTFLRSWLGRMLFSGEEALKKAKVLSGGEKVRCMLAKIMLTGGNILILDEPTNHLDLESITALNKGMTGYKSAMLFTTHDQEILQTTANRIIEIEGGKKIYDKEVTLDDWLATK